MKCRDCEYISEAEELRPVDFPSVRCTLGLWDEPDQYTPGRMIPVHLSYGSMQRKLSDDRIKIIINAWSSTNLQTDVLYRRISQATIEGVK
ncbi:hypothetical protein LCGC14_0674750 [marine sediment metagenome]|uniref:Uncharacterized protein n=1 Tax=marine sediment metagenome TaxID=412755 RepID=A0A0F9TY07_9ZZZZ